MLAMLENYKKLYVKIVSQGYWPRHIEDAGQPIVFSSD